MARRRKRYDKRFKVSAAKVVLSGEMTAKSLSEGLGIKDPTLRRWAAEYDKMAEAAFPGNGSPKASKNHGIVRLKKKVEEFERENEMLKNFWVFSNQDHARGFGSSKDMGRARPHQEGMRAAEGVEIGLLRASRTEEAGCPDRALGARRARRRCVPQA